MFEVAKGSVWLSSLASGKPYARGEMRSRDLPQLSILSLNLRGLKKTGKEAETILRIKERRLFAAMFQETWKAGSEVRENEGITFLEHGLATKVCPRGSQGVAIALGTVARKAWERAGSLRLAFGPRILATRLTIMDQHRRPASLFLVSSYAQRARQKPAIQREEVATSAAPAHVHPPHAAQNAAGAAACIPTTRPHRAGPCGLRCALPSCSPGE